MNSISGKSFFCSWSGGKDSCLALQRAKQQGGNPAFLLTMLSEDGQRSHSHGLPVPFLQRQSQALKIPLVTCSASWSEYTGVFTSCLQGFKTKGIQAGVFGDFDIEEHRQWCQEVCNASGLEAIHPLWQSKRLDLLYEFLDQGFTAIIVSVKQDYFGKGWLGRQLTREIIQQMIDSGIDPCGENGEYHTVVIEGPLFATRVDVQINRQEFHDGYWFLNIS